MKKILFLLLCTVASYGQTYQNPTFGTVKTKTAPTVTTTPNLGTVETDGTIGKITPENLPVSTATTNALDLKTTLSAGAFSGFEVTNNGDGTINVGSGIAYLRATNDQYAPLIKYPIAAYNNIPLVDNMNNYILVSYNGGSPALVLNTTGSGIDTQTNSIAVAAARVGTTVHYVNLTGSNSDPNAKLRNRYLFQEGIRRISGLIISSTGLKIATTSGITFSGLIRLDVSAIDTNAGGTYTLAYNNGSTWTRITGQTDINNTQYNNAGTLTTLSNNHFRTDYVYTLVNSPSKLYVILGTAEYGNLASAQAAPQPSSLPVELQQLGVIVGRVIVEKSATTLNVASPFTTTFTGATAQNHNDLAGLQGGTSGEYNHLTNAQVTLVNGSEQTTNKSDSYTVSSSTTYASTKAVVDGLSTKLNGSTYTATPTASAFSHYFGETASDGIIRPKTLANVKTEIVTTAAVDAAKSNIVTGTGTNTSIVKWTGTNTVGNSNITDNGTIVSVSTDMSANGMRVGRGVGNDNTNTVLSANGLSANTTGLNLTSIGYNSLSANTTGVQNLGLGYNTLTNNTTGNANLAIGTATLYSITSGSSNNVAVGTGALVNATSINKNTSIGDNSFYSLSSGDENVSIGRESGRYDSTSSNLTSATSTTLIGASTKPLGSGQSNQIVIGYNADGLGSNTTVIGNSSTSYGRFWGNLLVGISTNNGNIGRFAGTVDMNALTLNNAPTTSAGSYDILTRNSSTGVVEKVASSVLPSYKKYVALMTQSGSGNPVATVLENTLGGTVVWTRTSSGSYKGELSGAFTTDKTVIFFNASDSPFQSYIKLNTVSNYIDWQNGSDDRMGNNGTMIEIRVYP